MPDTEIEYGGEVVSLSDEQRRLDIHERMETQRLRRMTLFATLWPFTASNLVILALFIWKAIVVHGDLSEKVLLYLAGITLSQNAVIVVLSTKSLFHVGPKR